MTFLFRVPSLFDFFCFARAAIAIGINNDEENDDKENVSIQSNNNKLSSDSDSNCIRLKTSHDVNQLIVRYESGAEKQLNYKCNPQRFPKGSNAAEAKE